MIVHLVRHTSVEIDGNHTCYGYSDVNVRETFDQEASLTLTAVQNLRVDGAFTSPLKRASLLADFCGYRDALQDERLREMNFGAWELRPWSEIIEGNSVSDFFLKYLHLPVPGGESLLQQQARIADFLSEKKAKGHQSIIVFCHGGVINCARALAGGIDLVKAFEMLPAFGSVTTITI